MLTALLVTLACLGAVEVVHHHVEMARLAR